VFILNKFDAEDMDPDNKFLSNNIGAIHILYIRGDGQKIQRNANAALLEKF